MEDITSSYEVKFAAHGDLAGLRFIDPLLRADPTAQSWVGTRSSVVVALQLWIARCRPLRGYQRSV